MKKNFVKTLIMAMAITAMVGATGVTSQAAEATTTSTQVVAKQNLNKDIVAQVFDAKYYAETYPDVVAVVGSDETALLNHYMQFGIYEGRDASATFNADAYLSANTDLATVFGNNLEAAIEHYEQFGINESRIATVADATTAGITVTSATNPELIIATPAPKMVKGTSYSGGGSSSSSGSSVSGGSSGATTTEETPYIVGKIELNDGRQVAIGEIFTLANDPEGVSHRYTGSYNSTTGQVSDAHLETAYSENYVAPEFDESAYAAQAAADGADLDNMVMD